MGGWEPHQSFLSSEFIADSTHRHEPAHQEHSQACTQRMALDSFVLNSHKIMPEASCRSPHTSINFVMIRHFPVEFMKKIIYLLSNSSEM